MKQRAVWFATLAIAMIVMAGGILAVTQQSEEVSADDVNAADATNLATYLANSASDQITITADINLSASTSVSNDDTLKATVLHTVNLQKVTVAAGKTLTIGANVTVTGVICLADSTASVVTANGGSVDALVVVGAVTESSKTVTLSADSSVYGVLENGYTLVMGTYKVTVPATKCLVMTAGSTVTLGTSSDNTIINNGTLVIDKTITNLTVTTTAGEITTNGVIKNSGSLINTGTVKLFTAQTGVSQLGTALTNDDFATVLMTDASFIAQTTITSKNLFVICEGSKLTISAATIANSNPLINNGAIEVATGGSLKLATGVELTGSGSFTGNISGWMTIAAGGSYTSGGTTPFTIGDSSANLTVSEGYIRLNSGDGATVAPQIEIYGKLTANTTNTAGGDLSGYTVTVEKDSTLTTTDGQTLTVANLTNHGTFTNSGAVAVTGTFDIRDGTIGIPATLTTAAGVISMGTNSTLTVGLKDGNINLLGDITLGVGAKLNCYTTETVYRVLVSPANSTENPTMLITDAHAVVKMVAKTIGGGVSYSLTSDTTDMATVTVNGGFGSIEDTELVLKPTDALTIGAHVTLSVPAGKTLTAAYNAPDAATVNVDAGGILTVGGTMNVYGKLIQSALPAAANILTTKTGDAVGQITFHPLSSFSVYTNGTLNTVSKNMLIGGEGVFSFKNDGTNCASIYDLYNSGDDSHMILSNGTASVLKYTGVSELDITHDAAGFIYTMTGAFALNGVGFNSASATEFTLSANDKIVISKDATLTVPGGKTLTVAADATVTVNGALKNESTTTVNIAGTVDASQGTLTDVGASYNVTGTLYASSDIHTNMLGVYTFANTAKLYFRAWSADETPVETDTAIIGDTSSFAIKIDTAGSKFVMDVKAADADVITAYTTIGSVSIYSGTEVYSFNVSAKETLTVGTDTGGSSLLSVADGKTLTVAGTVTVHYKDSINYGLVQTFGTGSVKVQGTDVTPATFENNNTDTKNLIGTFDICRYAKFQDKAVHVLVADNNNTVAIVQTNPADGTAADAVCITLKYVTDSTFSNFTMDVKQNAQVPGGKALTLSHDDSTHFDRLVVEGGVTFTVIGGITDKGNIKSESATIDGKTVYGCVLVTKTDVYEGSLTVDTDGTIDAYVLIDAGARYYVTALNGSEPVLGASVDANALVQLTSGQLKLMTGFLSISDVTNYYDATLLANAQANTPSGKTYGLRADKVDNGFDTLVIEAGAQYTNNGTFVVGADYADADHKPAAKVTNNGTLTNAGTVTILRENDAVGVIDSSKGLYTYSGTDLTNVHGQLIGGVDVTGTVPQLKVLGNDIRFYPGSTLTYASYAWNGATVTEAVHLGPSGPITVNTGYVKLDTGDSVTAPRTITANGNVDVTGIVTLDDADELNIASGFTFTVSGTYTVAKNSTVTNSGKLLITSAGKFINDGKVINKSFLGIAGTFQLGKDNNAAELTLDSTSQVVLGSAATFDMSKVTAVTAVNGAEVCTSDRFVAEGTIYFNSGLNYGANGCIVLATPSTVNTLVLAGTIADGTVRVIPSTASAISLTVGSGSVLDLSGNSTGTHTPLTLSTNGYLEIEGTLDNTHGGDALLWLDMQGGTAFVQTFVAGSDANYLSRVGGADETIKVNTYTGKYPMPSQIVLNYNYHFQFLNPDNTVPADDGSKHSFRINNGDSILTMDENQWQVFRDWLNEYTADKGYNISGFYFGTVDAGKVTIGDKVRLYYDYNTDGLTIYITTSTDATGYLVGGGYCEDRAAAIANIESLGIADGAVDNTIDRTMYIVYNIGGFNGLADGTYSIYGYLYYNGVIVYQEELSAAKADGNHVWYFSFNDQLTAPYQSGLYRMEVRAVLDGTTDVSLASASVMVNAYYTVDFTYEAAESIETTSAAVPVGGSVLLPSIAPKDGYNVAGWFAVIGGEKTLVGFPGTYYEVTDDVTLIAQYTEKKVLEAIDYGFAVNSDDAAAAIMNAGSAYNGGVSDNTMYIVYFQNGYVGKTITGYVYDAAGAQVFTQTLNSDNGVRTWLFSDQNEVTAVDFAAGYYQIVIKEGDNVLLTKQVKVELDCTLTFVNGDQSDSATVKVGSIVVLPSATAADGQRFIGWAVGESTEATLFAGNYYTIPGDITLTAVFADQITVTFSVDGAQSSVTGRPGFVLGLPDASKEGFEFVGWYTADGTYVGGAGYTYNIPAEDITLTARFAEIYTVSFSDGQKVTGIAGEQITLPSSTVAKGKFFVGWSADGSTTTATLYAGNYYTITGDVTLTAVIVSEYSVTVNTPGVRVFIDGYAVFGTVALFEGEHTIAVQLMPGYKLTSGTEVALALAGTAIADGKFTVTGNATITATNVAAKAVYNVTVTEVAGVRVFIDGYEVLGTFEMYEGSYSIVAQLMPGYTGTPAFGNLTVTDGKFTLSADTTVTVTGVSPIVTYTVVFSDGQQVTGVKAGEQIVMPTTAVAAGKYFVGWSLTEGRVSVGIAGQYYTIVAPESGTTVNLYAVFGDLAGNHTVTYMGGADGTTELGKMTVRDGGYAPLYTVSLSGYTFDGWFTAAAGGDSLGMLGNYGPITEDVIIYAHYTAIVSNTHTVTYNQAANGAVYGTRSADTGETAFIIVSPNAGYVLQSLTVSGAGYVKISEEVYVVIMGADNLTVTPVFAAAPTYFTMSLAFGADNTAAQINLNGNGTVDVIEVTYYYTKTVNFGGVTYNAIASATADYTLAGPVSGMQTLTETPKDKDGNALDNVHSMTGVLKYTVGEEHYCLLASQVVYV